MRGYSVSPEKPSGPPVGITPMTVKPPEPLPVEIPEVTLRLIKLDVYSAMEQAIISINHRRIAAGEDTVRLSVGKEVAEEIFNRVLLPRLKDAINNRL